MRRAVMISSNTFVTFIPVLYYYTVPAGLFILFKYCRYLLLYSWYILQGFYYVYQNIT